MHCITKVKPIHFLDGKCHYYKESDRLKSLNLFNRSNGVYVYHIISHHWLLMPLGADTHTNTQSDATDKSNFRKPTMPGLKIFSPLNLSNGIIQVCVAVLQLYA